MAYFDVEGARQAGYSDADIASHLAESRGFDLEGARASGHEDADIVTHLSEKEEEGFLGMEIGREFRRGKATMTEGELLFKQRFEGGLTEEEQFQLERAGVQVASPSDNEDAGFVEKVVEGFSELVGQQAAIFPHALKRGVQLGATGAAIGAASGAVTGPGAILTAAGGGVAGFKVGFTGGMAEAYARSAQGRTTQDLIEAGASGTAAEIGGAVYGLAEGALEMAGLHILTAPVRKAGQILLKKGVDEGAKAISRATVKQALVKGLLEHAKSQTGEIITENLQEVANAAVNKVVGDVENIPELQSELDADKLLPRMWEITKKTFYATVIPGLAGGGGTYLAARATPAIKADGAAAGLTGDGGDIDAQILAATEAAHAAGAGRQAPRGAIPMTRGPALNVPMQPTQPPPGPTPAAEVQPTQKPQGLVDYGPAYDTAYQEALDAGASRGQAHEFGMEAGQDEAVTADLHARARKLGVPKSMLKDVPTEQLRAFIEKNEPEVEEAPAPEADQPGRKLPEPKATKLEAPAWMADEVREEIREAKGVGTTRERLRKKYGSDMVDEFTDAELLDAAAHEAAPSPANDKAEPTEAQAKAGNYAKGHPTPYPGINVSIENPAGSVRKGIDEKGNAWEIELKDHYGYIKRTEGADGDQIDVFMPAGFSPDEKTDRIFVVDQKNPDGSFDEHKAVMGAKTADEARSIYLNNYDDTGPSRIMGVAEMSVEEFKQWVKTADTTKPASVPVEAPKAKPKAAPKKAAAPKAPVAEYPAELIPDTVEEIREELEAVELTIGATTSEDSLRRLRAARTALTQALEGKEKPAPVEKKAAPKAKAAPAQEAQAPEVGTPSDIKTVELGAYFVEDLRNRVKHDRGTLRKRVAALMGVKLTDLAPGKGYEHKYVEEAFEFAVVKALREVLTSKASPSEKLQQAKDLYELQAGLTQRDSKSMALQQYSTPAPLAYLMQRHLGMDKKGTLTVYEPTAGNGMLVAGVAKPQEVVTNELDTGPRTQHLEALGFTVTNDDASLELDPDMEGEFDRVIMNPPFGTADSVREFDGFPLKKLEHQIVAESLMALKDDGKAAFIVGGHNFKDGKMTGTDRVFLNYLYSHYNVTHNIDISGDVYRKQGTTFPIRLITIDGVKAQADKTFAPTTQAQVESAQNFDDVAAVLEGKEVPSVSETGAGSPTGKQRRGIRDTGERGDGAGGRRGDADRGKPGDREKPGERAGDKRQGREGTGKGVGVPDAGAAAGRVDVRGPAVGDRPAVLSRLSDEKQAKLDALEKELDVQLDPTTLRTGIDPKVISLGIKIATLYSEAGLRTIAEVSTELARRFGTAIRDYIKPIYRKIARASKEPGFSTKEEVHAFNLDDAYAEPKAEQAPKKAPKAEPPTQVSELQSRYDPVSQGESGGNLVPKNQAAPLRKALQKIVDAHGDLDTWVAGKLDYPSSEALYTTVDGDSRFSAEQIDAIALAIDAIEGGMGKINGDMTGIGKGRVAAALIRYANLQGKTAVFMTEKANLLTDMNRDLNDIGHEVTPFIMHGDKEANITDAQGSVVYKKQGGLGKRTTDTYRALKADPKKYLKDNDYGVLMTTYSQVRINNAQRDILLKLSDDNIVILDEAHNAGGEAPAQDRRPKAAKVDKDGNPKLNTAEYVREMIAEAAGVLYLSATFAKRPGNMPLYYRTVLGTSGLSFEQLTEAMKRGSTALQQVVSRFLTERGHYIRREQDFSQIDKMVRKVDDDNAVRDAVDADKLTSEMRRLVTFSRDLQEEMEAAWPALLEEEGHVAEAGQDNFKVNSVAFPSVVHNYVAQMLLAIKADAVANEAIDAFKRGEKPVIGLMNTMGSFLHDMMAAENLKLGDEIGTSFKSVLLKALRNTLRYTVKDEKDKKTAHYLTEMQLAEHAPDAYASYLRVKTRIEDLVTGVTSSPIDRMRMRLESAGIRTGEITGRDIYIDMQGNKGIIKKRSAQDTNRKKTIRGFNEGDIDALIINRAGSTGLSLHPTAKTADKRPRHMIVAQADLNVDTVIQMLGRIFRKGQVQKPSYTFFNTALPAETRPAVVLEGKLKSMSANTSADADSAFSQHIPDMMNQYGDAMVAQWLQSNPDVASMISMSVAQGDESGDVVGFFRKASGRIALLPAETQGRFYSEVTEMFEAHIEYLNSIGQNNLVTEDIDFRAETQRKDVVHTGTDPDNPFAADAVLEEMLVRNMNKPYSGLKLEEIVTKALAGDKPVEHSAKIVSDLRKAYDDYVAAQMEKREIALVEERSVAFFDQMIAEAHRTFTQAEDMIERYTIGSSHMLMLDEETGVRVPAVVTGVTVAKGTGNPSARSKIKFNFALASHDRNVSLRMMQYAMLAGSRENFSGEIRKNWDTYAPKETKATRYIVTGNLLAGFGAVKNGSVITFTRADGTKEQGILVPTSVDQEGIDNLRAWRSVNPEEAASWLNAQPEEAVQSISTTRDGVRVFRDDNGQHQLRVPHTKRDGAVFFLDKDLLALMESERGFQDVGRGTRKSKVGFFPKKNLQRVLEIVYEKDVRYSVRNPEAATQEAFSVTEEGEVVALNIKAIRRIRTALKKALPRGAVVNLGILETIDPEEITEEARKAHGKGKQQVKIAGHAETQVFSDGSMRSLIRLAMDAATEETGYHELFHVAENMGLITKEERAVLDKKYPPEAKAGAETRADAYARWVMGNKDGITAQAQRIFKKLQAFLERIKNALTGYGYLAADDVFADLESGELAKRDYRDRKPVARADYSLAEETDPSPAQAATRMSLRDRANKIIDGTDNAIASPLMGLEDADEYKARRYIALGLLGDVKEKTAKLYKMLRDLSGEDAKLVYEYLTNKEADINAVPEQWRKAAQEAKQTVETVGDILVAHRLLPQDVIDENRGQYLPRVYLKYLIGEEGVKAMSTGKKMGLGYTKKRNKNMTDEQRIANGEITDPAYLVSRAYNLPMRDVVILDWLNDIAKHHDWVLPGSLVEWAWQESPGYQLGPWSYDINEDGTYKMQRVKRSRKVFTHENVNASELNNFFGNEKVANAVREGKGTPAMEKIRGKETYKKSGWKKLGRWYRYKKNADGTYTIKAQEIVEENIKHDNVSPENLAGIVGPNRAQAMADHAELGRRVAEIDPFDWNRGKARSAGVGEQVRGVPKLKGGKLVSVFWLATERDRIRTSLHLMNEEKRAEAAKIADRMDALVKEFGPPEGTPMPEGYAQIPKGKKYGPLGGMVVRKEIANDLVGVVRTAIGDEGLGKQLDTFLKKSIRVWKWSKTAANVSGQVRNFVSNGIMLGMSGIGWHRIPGLMSRAAGEIRNNGNYWRIAKKYGVTEATFSNTELQRIETDLLDVTNRQSGGNFFTTMKLMAATFMNATGDVYQLMEALGKTAKIIDEIEKHGKSPEQAALSAHKWLFDYSEVSPTVKAARDHYLGSPFITYTLKVLPRILDSMVNHPMHSLPFMAATMAIPYAVAQSLDVDDEEYDKLMAAMPGWIQEKGHAYILPVKDEQGRWKVVDIGYFFPWSAWSESLYRVGKIAGKDREVDDVFKLVSGLGFAGSPAYDIITAVKTNIDPFSQRPIVDPYAPPGEKLQAVFTYMYNMAAPSWVNIGGKGFLGKEIDALTGKLDARGRPRSTHGDALARLIGVNLYNYDPVETRSWNIRDLQREITDSKAAMAKRLRSPNTTAEDRQAIVDHFTERINIVAEKLRRYAAESDSTLLYRKDL